MLNELKIGDLVRNEKGKHKNQTFIVVRVEEKFAYVVNGKDITSERPKKKNKKHLTKLNGFSTEVQDRLNKGMALGKKTIKRALAENKE
jgi:ribosomal protein L14E/L6E/L27E